MKYLTIAILIFSVLGALDRIFRCIYKITIKISHNKLT